MASSPAKLSTLTDLFHWASGPTACSLTWEPRPGFPVASTESDRSASTAQAQLSAVFTLARVNCRHGRSFIATAVTPCYLFYTGRTLAAWQSGSTAGVRWLGSTGPQITIRKVGCGLMAPTPAC